MSNINSASVLNLNTVSTDVRVENTQFNNIKDITNVDLTKAAAEPTARELQQAVEVINQAAIIEQRSLNFSIDEVSGRSIIKVVDQKTEQLIRQIPSEELLKVAQDIRKLQEEMGQSLGLLIDRKI